MQKYEDLKMSVRVAYSLGMWHSNIASDVVRRSVDPYNSYNVGM